MKYIVILGDGMADYPQMQFSNLTPLQIAYKPAINLLARKSEVGLCKTIPEGMSPGSDVANLSVLGYNPKDCYTGRSPLEAASIGIDLKKTDVTARANLVTLSNEDNFEDRVMIDYSAGEISTAEAKELIDYLAKNLNSKEYKLYAGISYRHCFVVDNGVIAGDLTPPHDITGKTIKEYLPTSEMGKKYLDLMKKSATLLKDHPINLKRIQEGKNPANSLWFWGEGTKPNLENFEKKFGIKGGIISAVDLLKGIAKLSGMEVIDVEGATGTFETNYKGKAKACVDALKSGLDYVYVHVEAPDECGHHGDIYNKTWAISKISEQIVQYVQDKLEKDGYEYKMLICPDHPTPVTVKTHVSDPVPYLLYDSRKDTFNGATLYSEKHAKETGVFVESGYELMQKLLAK